MKPTLMPSNFLTSVRREERSAVPLAHDVRGQVLEVGPGEPVAVLTAIDRMAAAALHAGELDRAFVELVVADRAEVEAEHVHRLDRRLVMEERREQRARADEVAGRDDERCSCSVASSVLTCVARYSTPPATTVPIRPAEPAGGSRFPWKSLNARSCTSTSCGTRPAPSGTRALAPGARIPSAAASVNPRMIAFLKLKALSLLSQFRS